MLQQEGILNVLKKTFFRRKMSLNFVTSGKYYWKLTKLIESINNPVFAYVLVLYKQEIILVGSVIVCKNSPECQKAVTVRKVGVGLILIR